MSLHDTICQRLMALEPLHVVLDDDSARHAGHAGAAGGGGHFNLTIVSAAFGGHHAVHRHRMVYSLLADLMPHRIHALSLKALSPDEWTDAAPRGQQ